MTVIVTTPNKVIEDKIIKILSQQTRKYIKSIIPDIKKDIQFMVKVRLVNSLTYDSLTNGILAKQFGFPDGYESVIVDSVIDKILDNIQVKFVDTQFGGIEIGILKEGFKDILNLPLAVIQDGNDYIPWLDWLLMQGDNIIVSNFSIAYGNFPDSRSGDAVMIQNIGGYFKVDSKFSGTENDNWLTRILSSIDNAITDIIKNYFK